MAAAYPPPHSPPPQLSIGAATRVTGHDGVVHALLCGKGRCAHMVYSGDDRGCVVAWQPNQRTARVQRYLPRPEPPLPPSPPILSLASGVVSLEQDAWGLMLCAVEQSGSLTLWSTAKQTQLVCHRTGRACGHAASASLRTTRALRVACSLKDGVNEVVLHDLAVSDGSCSRKLTVKASSPTAVAMSANGSRCFVGTAHNLVLIIDAETGETTRKIEDPRYLMSYILALLPSPDGRRLYVSALSRTVRCYDMEKHELLDQMGEFIPEALGCDVRSMSLTSDGSLLFCGGTAIQVQLWRVPEFVNCLRLSGFNDITLRLALSSDESRLYCAEGKSMSIFPIQFPFWSVKHHPQSPVSMRRLAFNVYCCYSWLLELGHDRVVEETGRKLLLEDDIEQIICIAARVPFWR